MKKIATIGIVTTIVMSSFASIVSAQDLNSGTTQSALETKQDIRQYKDFELQAIQKFEQSDKRGKATKTYKNAIDKLNFNYYKEIFAELTEYQKNNPSATADQINEHFMLLCEKYQNSGSSPDQISAANNVTNAFYNYVGGRAVLNSYEQALYDQDPSRGFQSLVAAQEALDWTLYKFGNNGHNDKSDAFRHSSWNIWITGFTGSVGWAKSWTDAHEQGATNQPSVEFNMDINNNTEGRRQAIAYNISPSSNVNDTRAATIAAYKSGNLQYISNGTRVNFRGYDSDFVN